MAAARKDYYHLPTVCNELAKFLDQAEAKKHVEMLLVLLKNPLADPYSTAEEDYTAIEQYIKRIKQEVRDVSLGFFSFSNTLFTVLDRLSTAINQVKPKNFVDPISQDKIVAEFRFVSATNHIYDIRELVTWFNTKPGYIDPIANLKFSDVDVANIKKKAEACDLKISPPDRYEVKEDKALTANDEQIARRLQQREAGNRNHAHAAHRFYRDNGMQIVALAVETGIPEEILTIYARTNENHAFEKIKRLKQYIINAKTGRSPALDVEVIINLTLQQTNNLDTAYTLIQGGNMTVQQALAMNEAGRRDAENLLSAMFLSKMDEANLGAAENASIVDYNKMAFRG